MKRFFERLTLFLLAAGFFSLPLPLLAIIPNDPHVRQWAYEHVKVYDAWNYATGSREVTVAVIDNGFDTFHPDLRDNVWRNEKEIWGNGIDDDNNGYIDDVWGWNFVDNNNDPRPDVSQLTLNEKQDGVFNHGTLVAGLIGAMGDNGRDGAGINWRVKLMNLKVVDSQGEGTIALLSPAIRYAVDNGADIINVSMVGDPNEEIRRTVKYAYEKGAAVIAAAGNDMRSLDIDPLYPICADAGEKEEWVLGVSAIDQNHHLTRFSNIGATCINIAAPGTEVSSTIRWSPLNGLPKSYGGDWSGTSFAAPLVTGAAALVKSLQPAWGPKEIFYALTSTVHHTPGQDETVYASLFGAGLLQIDKAVKFAAQSAKTALGRQNNYLVFYDSVGQGQRFDPAVGEQQAVNWQVLSGVEDAATYVDSGRTYLITSRQEGKKRSISFYMLSNDFWVLIRSWSAAVGASNLAAIDFNQDGETEIVLLPRDLKEKIKVYSVYGEERARPEFLTTLPGIYDLTAGDFNGNGQTEIAVGAAVGYEPFISIYTLEGVLSRRWWAYDPAYRAGVKLQALDYDGDGRTDIAVWGQGQPIRVWSSKSKKLFQGEPADNVLAY